MKRCVNSIIVHIVHETFQIVIQFIYMLQVPKTKTNNGLQIAGFVTVCKQLARLRNAELLGLYCEYTNY